MELISICYIQATQVANHISFPQLHADGDGTRTALQVRKEIRKYMLPYHHLLQSYIHFLILPESLTSMLHASGDPQVVLDHQSSISHLIHSTITYLNCVRLLHFFGTTRK